jgi:outer membrane protein assembly factor BamA
MRVMTRRRDGVRECVGIWAACLVVIVGLISPSSTAAQDTRAAEIEAKQQEKAAAAAPYEPTGFETFMIRLEENFASPPNGFYPEVGSIYPGGGLSFGLGYRRFYARNAVWDIRGLYSIKNYKQVEVGTRTPWHGNGRWSLGVRAGWLDAPQIGYFGQGTLEDAPRANFHLTQGYGALAAALRPTSWTRLQAEVGYDDYETSEGRGNVPSIETIYDASSAPGLFSSPAFLRAEGTAAIDWRTSPGYSRKGGFYGVTFANYTDRNDTFSFQRLDGEIIQHLPILRENWVISLRGRVQTTVDDNDAVPYFLLPQLGSGRTLRGYETGRFRDRHSILTSAEFRWIPNRMALDMAIFYDAGKVTRRREDLDLRGLTSDYGIGARFHGPTRTVLRIEAARGSEGWRLVVGTNAAF